MDCYHHSALWTRETELLPHASNETTGNGAVSQLFQLNVYEYIQFKGPLWYLMAIVASFLLLFGGLLSGLVLAIYGMDMTYLQMRSITGTVKRRKQATRMVDMKENATWLLCSLILVSTICIQFVPILIQALGEWEEQWVPVLISIVFIVFFAGLLPQYLVPQDAIAWGYYCYPIVWGCMLITALISRPVAWLLDYIRGKVVDKGIFTNDELALIIKYHERTEKHGGMLGPDATRIMLGALSLDSCNIGGEIVKGSAGIGSIASGLDLEKASLAIVHGLILDWSHVQTVNIDDSIDFHFIQKIKSWSYSRIPVVGSSCSRTEGLEDESSDWRGAMIFGFIHIKDLVGLDVPGRKDSRKGILVNSLPLYPLPIVREDMPVYELLNMFQRGISRMAVVIPATQLSLLEVHHDLTDVQRIKASSGPAPTTTEESKALRGGATVRASTPNLDWTADFLAAAQNKAKIQTKHNALGIRSPEPLGIVTFEDIIDTVLQKTSHDEKDFFNRGTTKMKKATKHQPSRPATSIPSTSNNKPQRSTLENALRKRKISANERPTGVMDGADDYEMDDRSATLQGGSQSTDASSYTQNSQGGFHGSNASSDCTNKNDNCIAFNLPSALVSSPDLSLSANSEFAQVNLPSCKGIDSSHWQDQSESINILKRGFTEGGGPTLPRLRRVSPFSRQDYSSSTKSEHRVEIELKMPLSINSILAGTESTTDPVLDRAAITSAPSPSSVAKSGTREASKNGLNLKSGDTVSLGSWSSGRDSISRLYSDGVVETSFQVSDDKEKYSQKASEKPYGGFPAELLEESNQKNRRFDFSSHTLPAMGLFKLDGDVMIRASYDSEIASRERSFHDDRALLPSQRKETSQAAGYRSSSIWF